METCKHGSGAGSRKPTAEMRQGAECRAYDITGKVCMIGKDLNINITSGNGEYSVVSENPERATAEIAEDVIKVTGVSKGEVNITVTDKMKLTSSIKIRVTGGLDIETTQIDNLW